MLAERSQRISRSDDWTDLLDAETFSAILHGHPLHTNTDGARADENDAMAHDFKLGDGLNDGREER